MANTFELISAVTVGSGGAASIDFTSISSSYTDLCLKISTRNSTGSDQLLVGYNGVGTGYATRIVYGNSVSAASASLSTKYIGTGESSAMTANTFGSAELYVPNYAGSNYKSSSSDSVTETNSGAANSCYVVLAANLWSNTAAITSISLTPDSGTFVQYSTAYLYGVKNA